MPVLHFEVWAFFIAAALLIRNKPDYQFIC